MARHMLPARESRLLGEAPAVHSIASARGCTTGPSRRPDMRLLTSFALLVVTCAGVSHAHPVCEPDEVDFEVVLMNSLFDIFAEPRDFVIRNEHQWCRFWRDAHAALTDPPECDRSAVDFRHETVIASALGNRPNGCFGVHIGEIRRVEGTRRLTVFVEERTPGRDCLCTQSFISPVQAVVVPARVRWVEFVHETSVVDCTR